MGRLNDQFHVILTGMQFHGDVGVFEIHFVKATISAPDYDVRHAQISRANQRMRPTI